MPRFTCRPFLLGLVAAGFAFSAQAETATTLAEAERLLADRQAAQAFALLAPLEDEQAGTPAYDYLLGMAALESGQPGHAAFAFERCLTVEPTHGHCRVQMARTHIALGEDQAARQALATLQGGNPSPEVARLASDYRGMLTEPDHPLSVRSYIQAGLGVDSNVNSANSLGQLGVPGFPVLLPLPPGAVEQDDNFAQLQAGAGASYRLADGWGLLGSASLASRQHEDIDTFDFRALDLSAGVSYQQGQAQYQLRLLGQDYVLDNNDFRQLWGGLLQYQRSLGHNRQVSTYLQLARLDYQDQAMRNADRRMLGMAYSQPLALRFSPVVFGSFYAGEEATRDSAFDYLGHAFFGTRLGGMLALSSQLQLAPWLGLEQRRYDATNPFFSERRSEIQYDAGLGLVYQLDKQLSLRPAYGYTRSDSNLQINDYERHVLSLDLRYEL